LVIFLQVRGNSKSVVVSAVDLEVEGSEFEVYIATKLHVTTEMKALFGDICAVGSSFNGSCPP
jgi:phage baseplate assembly protein gpV